MRLADDERELGEREVVERLLPEEDLLVPDDERLRELADERLRLEDERLPDPLFALLPDERLEPLAFFLPPEPPLLRRSAMSRSPS